MAVEFLWEDPQLVADIGRFSPVAQELLNRVVSETSERAIRIFRDRTPVATQAGKRKAGKPHARDSWVLLPQQGGTREMVNKVPHINVLEYGGYPVRKNRGQAGGFVRGKARLGGRAPGPRTRTKPGGKPEMRSNVTKQAPKGIVRSTLLELEAQFLFDVGEALDVAWAAS